MAQNGTDLMNNLGMQRISHLEISIKYQYLTCITTITLFKCITMFCGTDNILWNNPHIEHE